MTKETLVVHASLDPLSHQGMVNPPVYHTSTIMQPTLDDYRNDRGAYEYGRMGTPTSEATEKAVARLYGMDECVATPSGLSAICLAVSAAVKSGDRVLFPDSMYGSGRRFCEKVLPQMGVEPVFYHPLVDADALKALITGNTTLVYLESPGSLTFEMQDVPALTQAAHDAGCLVAIDNTWGTAFYFDAAGQHIDIVIEAGTKYISGHSDVSIGFVIAQGKSAEAVRRYALLTGLCVAPDDHYLALRGMRTMALRLKQSGATAITLASWLEQQPEVVSVLHPALPSHPQHERWQRDFTGSSGLFGFVLDEKIPAAAVDAMADGLALYGIGASWGGHESLISQSKIKRSVSDLPDGHLLRIYAGLEDEKDLLDDLAEGFERMRRMIT